MDVKQKALQIHEKYKGKLEVKAKIDIKSPEDLSLVYTPGVAEPCIKISQNPEDVYKYTTKGNTVAVRARNDA
ncbi:hypothetical protein FEF22_000255 [Texas Phoenix palm phytoplasma]|uniref:Malic enzyme N-terminal domain-containing protein n=1 Tax=Texas Phoenix palm phytoplasma TaxID=176709 RepID=A0ABS5BI16_9MOLU|nr:hypothetical protein [Texas Phoenix palm phytoplasma]